MLVRCPFCRTECINQVICSCKHFSMFVFSTISVTCAMVCSLRGTSARIPLTISRQKLIETQSIVTVPRETVISKAQTSCHQSISRASVSSVNRCTLFSEHRSIEAMQITDKLSIYLTGVTFKDILSSRIVEYYFYENIQITPWKLQQHSSPIEPKVKTESSTKVYHSEDIFEESDVKYMALLKPSKGQQKQTKEIKLQQEYDGQFGQVMGGKTQQSTMIKLIGEKFKCHATTLTSVIKQKRQELSEGMRSSTDTLASTFNMLKSEFKCLKSELPSLKELAIQKSLKEKYFFWRK